MLTLMRNRRNKKAISIIALAMVWRMLLPAPAFSQPSDSVFVTAVIAAALNDPPVLGGIGDKLARTGEEFLIRRIDAADVNNDTLSIDVVGLAEGMRYFRINAVPGWTEYRLRWPEMYVQEGVYDLTFTATDGEGGTDTETITITIISTEQHPPMLYSVGNQTGVAGEEFLIKTMAASDVDSDYIRMEATGLAEGMRYFQTVSSAGYTECRLRWPASYVIAGTYTVTFTAIDDYDNTDSETITIEITGSTQHDPVLYSIGNQRGTPGEEFLIRSIVATDIDGDTLTIDAAGLEEGMRYFQVESRPGYVEYRLRWPAAYALEGTYIITFTVSDGNGNTVSEQITIEISHNGPPYLHPIGDQFGSPGEEFLIRSVVASDPDPDFLDMTADGLEDTMRFFQTVDQQGYAEYRLRWLEGDVVEGEYVITFTVSDGKGGTDSETITVLITDNREPVLESVGDQQGYEGQEFLVRSIIARDEDPDTLTIHADNLPDTVRFFEVDSRAGYAEYRLRWLVDYVKSGDYDVVFSVTDGRGGRDQEKVKISVTGILSIDVVPETGIVPLDVQFDSDLTGGWSPALTWNFGDGSQDTVEDPLHAYTSSGDYNVTLDAADGATNSQRTAAVRVFRDETPAGLGPRALFVWEAWDQGSAEGWTSSGGLGGLSLIGNGAVTAASGDNDSYMDSPGISVDASELKKVLVRLRIRDADITTAKLSWRRAGDTDFTSQNSVTFPIINDAIYRTYGIDLSSHLGWRGKIVQLRLHPTLSDRGRAQIDFIRIVKGDTPSVDDVNWEFEPGDKGMVNNPVKRKELLDFCRVKGVSLLFLNSQGVVFGTAADRANFTTFINEAHAENIDVYGLQGLAWWSIPEGANVANHQWTSQEGWEYLQAVMAYGRFDGIIDDTEPYVVDADGWANNLHKRAQWYLYWVQRCKDIINGQVPFISVTPFWFDAVNEALNNDATPRPLNEYVAGIADSVCIMDYRDFAEGPNGLIQHAENEINDGPTWVAVEVQNLEPYAYADLISFYEEGEAYMEGELTKVRNYFSGNSNYLGAVIHYYKAYKWMKP